MDKSTLKSLQQISIARTTIKNYDGRMLYYQRTGAVSTSQDRQKNGLS